MRPDRNLALELVRVTEAAAIAAAQHVGKGDKIAGDKAAVDAMRAFLSTVEMQGKVIIGEGEKDEAPMLFNGELVGSGKGAKVDIAVDPIEGTNLLAYGRSNSIAVIAAADSGSMWDVGDSLYMNKIVVEHRAKDAIDIRLSATENLQNIAKALDRPVSSLTVFILEKPRHKDLIQEIRQAGARISLQTDGDVIGALMAATPNTSVDVLLGIGGTPEGVIAAAAVKALDGGMLGQRCPQKDYELKALQEQGIDLDQILGLDDLIQSDNCFFSATGITDGGFLEGIQFDGHGNVTSDSIVIRSKTQSVRRIKGMHKVKHRLTT